MKDETTTPDEEHDGTVPLPCGVCGRVFNSRPDDLWETGFSALDEEDAAAIALIEEEGAAACLTQDDLTEADEEDLADLGLTKRDVAALLRDGEVSTGAMAICPQCAQNEEAIAAAL